MNDVNHTIRPKRRTDSEAIFLGERTSVERFLRACWQHERVCRVGIDRRGVEIVEVTVELAKIGGQGTVTSTGVVSCVAIEDDGDPEGLASSLIQLWAEALERQTKRPRGRRAPAAAAGSLLISRLWSKTIRSKDSAGPAPESEVGVNTRSNRDGRP